jgi:hypothetical protein
VPGNKFSLIQKKDNLKRRKSRDTIFWLGVDTGLERRIAETELKKRTEFFYFDFFNHWQVKKSYKFEKKYAKISRV